MYSTPDQLYPTYNIGLLSIYNSTLERAIESITELNHTVSTLSDILSRLDNSVSRNAQVQNGPIVPVAMAGLAKGHQETLPGASQNYTALSDMSKYIELAKAIGTVAKSSVEFGEATGGAPEFAAKLKPFIKGGNAIIDALGGVQKFVAATETFTSAAAAMEVITAALNAGEAASAAGPYAAMATALSVVVVSSVVGSLLKKISVESNTTSFLDEGLRNGNPYLVGLQQSKKNAYDMATRVSQETPQQLGKRKKKTITELLMQKGDLIFDSDRAANDQTYIPAFLAAVDKMDAMQGGIKKKLLFEDVADMKKFTESFDPFNHYNKGVMPLVAQATGSMSSADLPSGEGVIGYTTVKQDRENRKKRGITGGIPLTVWENAALGTMKNMYLAHDLAFVEDERERQLKQFGNIPGYRAESDKMLKLFKRMIPEIDGEKEGINANTVPVRQRNAAPSQYAGNTINFNRSLIEHFTINVKDGKEAMTDFKRKVEEVLIEILNSVNTIH